MLIDNKTLGNMMGTCADLLKEKSPLLSEIDSKFGDGDHGVTIGKIADLIKQGVASWKDESLQGFVDGLGTKIMSIGGGAAAPLWGTLFSGLAEPLEDAEMIDAQMLKAMLESSRNAMYEITAARVGDKTMMDVLIPAVDAALAAQDDVEAILSAARESAEKGAEATKDFAARFGRAKNYKEKSLGTSDAGAVSMFLLFEGFAQAVGL